LALHVMGHSEAVKINTHTHPASLWAKVRWNEYFLLLLFKGIEFGTRWRGKWKLIPESYTKTPKNLILEGVFEI
jgi:hypothetical protein